MRKPAYFLIILLTLTSLVLYAQPPRHVNPEEVQVGVPDPKFFSLTYAELANLLSTENYTGYAELSRYLLQVSAPGDIAYIMSRFHEIAHQEGLLLNYTKTVLERAKQYALLGDTETASKTLSEALTMLARVNASYISLADAAQVLQQRLKSTPTPLLNAIVELSRKYLANAVSINETLIANLTRTNLTLYANTDQAWIGSFISVRGELATDTGTPLPGRNITLLCDGSIVGYTTTGAFGEYNATIRIPYKYVESIILLAVFEPKGNDSLHLKPSLSDPVRIRVLFITPNITLTLEPDTALPGSKVNATATTDLPRANFTLWTFGEKIPANSTEGRASWIFRVPPDAREGTYLIRACTNPYAIYGPSCGLAELVVKKINLTISLEPPQILLALIPSTLKVSIQSSTGTPPNSTQILITIPEIGLAQQVETNNTYAEIPITLPPLASTGKATLNVIATPSDPSYSTATARVEVLLVNPLLLAFVTAAIVGAVTLYKKMRNESETETTVEPPARIEAAPTTTKIEPPEITPKKEPIVQEIQVEDPVVDEYMKALRATEKYTGIYMKPSQTISEYLEAVRPRLGMYSQYFEQISRLVEARLYADTPVDPGLVRKLREELEKGLGGNA